MSAHCLGGPPGAAICIRAGWTMGRVKAIYMRYVSAGDEFVGRCLSMLPLLSSKFSASPPHFKDDADEEFLQELVKVQFPTLYNVQVIKVNSAYRLKRILDHGSNAHRRWNNETHHNNPSARRAYLGRITNKTTTRAHRTGHVTNEQLYTQEEVWF